MQANLHLLGSLESKESQTLWLWSSKGFTWLSPPCFSPVEICTCYWECEKHIFLNCAADAAQVHQPPQEMIALFGIDTGTSTQQVCYKSLQK